MKYKVLEVNVDDLGFGGVYSLVKSVIENKPENLCIDIAAIEKFERQSNVENLKAAGTSVHYIGYDGNKLLKQFVCMKNLIRLIKKGKYDCIHIHADVANKILISAIAGRIAGVKKIILHSHAAGVDGNHRTMKKIFHKVSRRFLKLFGTDFVSCSDLASAWMFPNVSSKRITLVKNGVDLIKFRFNEKVREDMRRELKLEDSYVLGHVGRFAYQKNHDFMIDMFAEVKKNLANAKLLLIGEGGLEDEIREKVKGLKLEDSVIFYGISNQVQNLFQAMDIFVLPSHFEGLPVVGVEAQASGLPVLFSDQITKKAKLTDRVEYIAIDRDSITDWCKCIMNMQKFDRADTYQELKSAGFSLDDTINSLLMLYEGGKRSDIYSDT